MPTENAQTRYRKATLVNVQLQLNRNTDSDILAHLQTITNKQGYIKSLIRADIAKVKKGECKQMATYRVKAEYIDKWSNDPNFADNPIVTEAEISRLAAEWSTTVDVLMEQLEKESKK